MLLTVKSFDYAPLLFALEMKSMLSQDEKPSAGQILRLYIINVTEQ